MTKRFIAILGNKYHRIEDNETNSVYYSEDAQSIDWLVELLNALHTENQQLKERNAHNFAKKMQLMKENEQLRQQLQEYKENWDDMVELATKTSLRNIELDEQIGRLQKLNDD